MQAQDARNHLLLVRQAVALQLQIVAVLSEQPAHLQGVGLRPLVVPVEQPARDLPAQAGRQGNKSLAVGTQQIHVDAGLDIEALGEGHGHHVGEVAVSRLIPAQQHQVAGGTVQLVDPVKAGAGSHIDLAADDGLDPRRLAGLIEVDNAVHHPVVGDGYRFLPQLLHPLDQALDAAGPVQQGVFRMRMKMCKAHILASFSISPVPHVPPAAAADGSGRICSPEDRTSRPARSG